MPPQLQHQLGAAAACASSACKAAVSRLHTLAETQGGLASRLHLHAEPPLQPCLVHLQPLHHEAKSPLLLP